MKTVKKVLILCLTISLLLTGCTLGGSSSATVSNNPSSSNTDNAATGDAEIKVGLEKNKYSIPDYNNVDSDVKVLRQSTSMGEADYGVSASGVYLKTFVDRIEEISNGKMVCQVYPGSQLATTTDDIMNGVMSGAFELSDISTGSFGDYTTAFTPVNIPFLYANDDIAYDIMTGDIGKEMFDQLYKDTSLRALGFIYLGMRTITNNSREIHSPDDVAGLKIRVQADPTQLAAFEALGASTMTVSYAELFTALQQGLCDGQDNPVVNIVGKKFFEVQKYMTILNHLPTISPVFISDKYWNSLTEEEQGWVTQAATDATEASYQTCKSTVDILINQMKDYGIVVTELTTEEHQQFADKMSGVWETCKESMGENAWNELMTSVDSVSAKYGY